jgi:hypothetical protein
MTIHHGRRAQWTDRRCPEVNAANLKRREQISFSFILSANKKQKTKNIMKNIQKQITSVITIVAAVLSALAICAAPISSQASGGSGGSGGGGGSGGSGGGGGAISTPTLSGNWVGSALVDFVDSSSGSLGSTAFSLSLSVSGSNISGSAHFGLPIFDSTLKLTATTPDGIHFSGFVFNGEGSLPISGVMSADGKTIFGTVIDGGLLLTYTVTRN